jgi:hypothetical protein
LIFKHLSLKRQTTEIGRLLLWNQRKNKDMRRIFLSLCFWFFAGPSFAQSAIDQLSPVPNFPFPDPAVTSQNLWMSQNGTDYRATITQLGYILQMNCNLIQGPFVNQLCWNTNTTPAVLQTYQGGVWVPFPGLTAFAPLNSPAFTGIATAPTAPPGTNTTQIATTAFVTNAIRIQAPGPVTLYVATTGSDLNNSCTVQANPCLNVQTAVNLIANTYDMHGNDATIHLADGTYALSSIIITGTPVGANGTVSFNIMGNQSSPDNVSLLCSASCFDVALYGHVLISGMKLTSTLDDIWAHHFGSVNFSAIDFGTTGGIQIYASENGIAQAVGNYTISGGAQDHWVAANGGQIFGFPITAPLAPFPSIVINLLNTPAFSDAFARSNRHAMVRCDTGNSIFTGTGATGVRYIVSTVSLIETNGGGSSFLPGSISGTADAGSYGSYH